MGQIRFEAPDRDSMQTRVTQIPALPGSSFGIHFPESIGSTESAKWFNVVSIHWGEKVNGRWSAKGGLQEELSFTIDVIPYEDHVDLYQTLTNDSSKPWRQTMAFNCFNAGTSSQIRDHDCVRHWTRSGGRFRRLSELPRVLGPRPALQLYSVEGQPPGKDIAFVDGFESTPDDVAIEGWLAIESRDGKKLVATVSKPALFTFQNMEYSCIHSSPTFGPLDPGQTGMAFTRLYFVDATLQEWYSRMTEDISQVQV
jgi:hypothetical protein